MHAVVSVKSAEQPCEASLTRYPPPQELRKMPRRRSLAFSRRLDAWRATQVEAVLREYAPLAYQAMQASQRLLVGGSIEADAVLQHCSGELVSALRSRRQTRALLWRGWFQGRDGESSWSQASLKLSAQQELLCERVERLSGRYRLFRAALMPMLSRGMELHVHQLVAGTGGFARYLARATEGSAAQLRVSASDDDAQRVDLARSLAMREGVPVHFEVRHHLDLSSLADVDVLLCVHALHRFSPGDIVQLFVRAMHKAPSGLVIFAAPPGIGSTLRRCIEAAVFTGSPSLVAQRLRARTRGFGLAELLLLARLAGARKARAQPLAADCDMLQLSR